MNEEVPITMLLPAVGNELHSEPHSYDFPEEAEGGVGNEISVGPSNRIEIMFPFDGQINVERITYTLEKG